MGSLMLCIGGGMTVSLAVGFLVALYETQSEPPPPVMRAPSQPGSCPSRTVALRKIRLTRPVGL